MIKTGIVDIHRYFVVALEISQIIQHSAVVTSSGASLIVRTVLIIS